MYLITHGMAYAGSSLVKVVETEQEAIEFCRTEIKADNNIHDYYDVYTIPELKHVFEIKEHMGPISIIGKSFRTYSEKNSEELNRLV